MADAFPSFIATCKAPGVYIDASYYVVDMSVDSSPDKLILGANVGRYNQSTIEIDTKGHNPDGDTEYSKNKLANYSFVLKACSYDLTDPEAKQVVRALAVRVAQMSDAMPAPKPKSKPEPAPQAKPKASFAPTTAAQLRATDVPVTPSGLHRAAHHDLESILR